jgi:hypothetical protein
VDNFTSIVIRGRVGVVSDLSIFEDTDEMLIEKEIEG